ncbi:hypothetical protein V6N13_081230 [Hibiscus sabdariffa]
MWEHISWTKAIVQANTLSICALKAQLGQLASNLNSRQPGIISSVTDNPISKEKNIARLSLVDEGKEDITPTVVTILLTGLQFKLSAQHQVSTQFEAIPSPHFPRRFKGNEHDRKFQLFQDT